MTVQTRATQNRYLERPAPSSLADVIDVILDKGLVIDAYVRASLLGIELVTIDARIVVASVDTYLRFAQAVNRMDLTEAETRGIPELMQDMTQSGARGKTKDQDEDEGGGQPARRKTSSRRRSGEQGSDDKA